ncbi:MAG: 4Fe-4S dicluster domain-containing protein [Candidatus Hodarchaeota archaeon]
MILPNENIDSFFESLKKYGRVFGPVKSSVSSYAFRRVNSIKEVELQYPRTMIPPKKLFLKPTETIFGFDEASKEYTEVFDNDGTFVVLGIHGCDLNAIKLLDRVYIDEFQDKYYMKRRENSFLIGVACEPDEYCFCESMGTFYPVDTFDLFLNWLGKVAFVRVGSEKGYEFVIENKGLFRDPDNKEIQEFKKWQKHHLDKFKLKLNTAGLTDMLELVPDDSEIWKNEADRCFGCGTCNLVCPTCRCYDVIDKVNLDIKTGERVREWSSCMLRKHALVAGGENFRPTRVERLRNRFNCKSSLREDVVNCVGCGRCTVYCMADIDYVEVLKKVRSEL